MINICKNCKKEFVSRKSSKKYCSPECFKLYRSRPDVKDNINKKRIKTNLLLYGVDNPAKNDAIKLKVKKTCNRKYGANSPSQNIKIKNKQIQTNINRYGTENPFQNENIQQKQKKTMFDKYGTTVPLKNANILNKLKNTCIDKYGVDNVAKLPEVRLKMKNTCENLYGSEYAIKNENIKNKLKNTIYKKTYHKLLFDIKFNDILPLFTEQEYLGNISYKTKYKFICKTCNTEFDDTLINGNIPRCPTCFPKKINFLESEIYDFIKSILPNEIIERGNRTILNGKELDIYIPNKNIAIEFNGLYWHSEISGKKDKMYHLNKTNICKENKIRLLHIFDDEWNLKNEIVKNRLKYILNTYDSNKIFARKCSIKNISSQVCNEFLNKNHIQGEDKSSIRLGAFYNDELVSVMTFGKLRLALGNKNTGNDIYEMYRYCSSKLVVGVGGKLFKYFIKNYSPKKIISYSDIRWNDEASIYLKLGFNLIKKTTPNYWYINKNYSQRFHRFNFRKSNLKLILEKFDDNISEWQNMQLNGYDRIWDCGNYVFSIEL